MSFISPFENKASFNFDISVLSPDSNYSWFWNLNMESELLESIKSNNPQEQSEINLFDKFIATHA